MTKIIALLTEITYNNAYKTVVVEPVLKGRFVQYAKRTQKSSNYRRRKEPYPLWRNYPYLLVLQKSEVEVVSTNLCKISSSLQSLSPSRFNISHYLCPDCRRSSLKQDKNSSGQWRLSTDWGMPTLLPAQ